MYTLTYILPGVEGDGGTINGYIGEEGTAVVSLVTGAVCWGYIVVVQHGLRVQLYPVCGVVHSTALKLQ